MPNLPTRLMRKFYRLTWKKIVGFNTLVLILAGLVISRQAALSPTRTRSEAALLPKPQLITREFETPTGPPEIFLVDHFFGKVGDAVLVHGENLGGLHENSFISLNGKKIEEEDLVGWAGNYIEFRVPVGARSGKVAINVLGNQTTWEGEFMVIDGTVETELRLLGEGNVANLSGKALKNGKNLLVWILVISGEGQVKMTAAKGVSMSQTVKNTQVGRIYEARIALNDLSLTNDSLTKFVPLLTVERGEEQLIGIARGELTDTNGKLIPLSVHPMYVSF